MWTDLNGQSNEFNFLLLSNSQVALEADIRIKGEPKNCIFRKKGCTLKYAEKLYIRQSLARDFHKGM